MNLLSKRLQEVTQNTQKANSLNALITKSLTSMHSRRAKPKGLNPYNLERQPTQRCTTCQFCPQREAPARGDLAANSLGVHFLTSDYDYNLSMKSAETWRKKGYTTEISNFLTN